MNKLQFTLPFLRFKEFKKNLINFSYINDVSEIKNGVGFPIIFQEKNDSKISFYKVSDLNQSSREINSLFSIDYKNIERLNSKPFFKPSICFAKIGEACKLNRKKVISSNFYFIDNNMSSLIPFDNIEFYYFYYFLCKLNFNSFIKTSNLPSIDIDILKKHKIFYPDIKEQIKISKFFSLLDKHIELWERKLQFTKLKKSWFINFVWRNSSFSEVNFLELFDYYDIQNKNFEKYTIGKKGIIKMNTIKETTENGRAFYKNSIIFGLGSNEIGVSIDKIGSCSPIYLTYKVKDSIYTKYFFYFSNYIFKEKENYFCKKSTRREKEISRKLLEKIKIKLIDFDSLWKMDILDFFTKEITFLDK